MKEALKEERYSSYITGQNSVERNMHKSIVIFVFDKSG
jgi:hypothetical protein